MNKAEVTEFLPLVHSIAKKLYRKIEFAVPNLDQGDLIAWGSIGLLHGLKEFDEMKNPNKRQYLSYRIAWAVHEGLKGWNRSLVGTPQRERAVNDVEIRFDDVHEGYEPGEDPDQHDNLIKTLLYAEVMKLPSRLRRVIIMRFYLGYQYSEISTMMGISKQRCEQILQRAIQRLQVQQKELEFERVSRQWKKTKSIIQESVSEDPWF